MPFSIRPFRRFPVQCDVTCNAGFLIDGYKRRVSLILISVLMLTGCVRTVPDLPEPKGPARNHSLKIVVRDSGLPTILTIQRPPTNFGSGFLRGSWHGAVYGFNVGEEWLNLSVSRSQDLKNDCSNGSYPAVFSLVKTALRPHYQIDACEQMMGASLITGLLGWLIAAPTIGITAGLQEGITAHSGEEIGNWAKAVEEAVGQDTLQIRFRDVLHDAIAICCRENGVEVNSSSGFGGIGASSSITSDQDLTILDTDVLEIGLAEYHDETLPEPDAEFQKVNIHPKAKKFANSLHFIFRKPPLGLYVLVRTRLIRALDGSAVDERYFGSASAPRQYMEWTEGDSNLLKLELASALRNISDAVITNLIYPSLWPANAGELDFP